LRSRGVGTETPVGICLDRSPAMVIGMIAALKAGGAYLPLDPAFPADRVAFMVADSAARAIVTQAGLRNRFAETQATVIDLEADADAIARSTPANLADPAGGARLAYLIYTSGSTGKPKGVMVEHRNVMNFFAAMDQILRPPDDPGVWLAVTSISFDISVLELLWTLARGFTVVIQPEEGKLETTGEVSIPAQIARHQVTHLQCTPAHARMLTRSADALAAMQALRVLLVGGEAFPVALAQHLREALPARIINMYGPTETTVWSASFELEQAESTVPIGRPIANTQIQILDTELQPVPIGEIGELYISGAGVARGYWRRPELTAECFSANPFATAPNDRLYRTGDLARYRTDGAIEFMGRADFQIKIHGFRIEIGEIEAVLGGHPGIREAVVIAEETPAGDPQLAAYLVARPDQGLSAAEVRIYARQKLPKYMVPVRFTFLSALPLTPNRKVDRKALAAPRTADQSPMPEAGERTELEQTIVKIWQELLGITAIGLRTNFFDLGATSLTVAEAATCLREALRREIKLTDLFAYPTVAALAAHLGGGPPTIDATNAASDRGAARLDALAGRASRRRET